MATASEDQTVVLWDLSGLEAIRNDPAAYACLRTGRGLNHDEWNNQIRRCLTRKLALAE